MNLIFLFDYFCADGKPDFNVIPYKRQEFQNYENQSPFNGWHFVSPYESLTDNNNVYSDVNISFVKTLDYYKNIEKYECDLAIYPIFCGNDEILLPWSIRYLSNAVVDLINKDKLKVALINYHESDRYDDYNRTLSYLDLFCSQLKIEKKENICLIGNDINTYELNKPYPSKHFPFYVIHGIPRYFLKKIHSLNLNTSKYIENYINKVDKEKVFLSMINHGRASKYLTHQYLRYTKCLDNAYYSYIKNDHYDNYKHIPVDDLLSRYPCIDEELDCYPPFKKFILDNLVVGNHLLPFDILDPTKPSYNVTSKAVYLNEKWTTDTYFSVVCETKFNDTASFVTEKTTKLFYYGHPFILIGGKNTLKEMRNMGFETFPELFDESYDSMPCNVDKLIYICNQVKAYNTPEGIQKLKTILPKLKDKLIYNRNHFINYDWNQFWKKLI